MTSPLDTERIQFFLRHRDEIREWAAIERELVIATRDVLAGLQPILQERIAAADPTAEVIRHDGGRYERILMRRPAWPAGIGVALEWETGVDPFGSALPKYGIFVLPRDGGWVAAHQAIDAEARASAGLNALEYGPGDGAWPVNQRVPKSASWWEDLGAWTAPFLDTLLSTWALGAPIIEHGLEVGR